MAKCLKIFTALIIISVLLIPNFQVAAASDETGISLQVTGVAVCNNNGICESGLGENESNCPADCGCNNNGVCETARGENNINCPLDCPPPGGGIFIPDTAPPVIFNLLVSEITLNSAKISWETDEFSLCQFFWGKTQEYELETIIEFALYRNHAVKLINLLPKTAYHFKISCRDSARNESETTDQRFTTLTPPDITPPANVSNFEAIAGDSQINLTWKNPPNIDFKAVKIMRSTGFFPSDPWSGVQVYNGSGTSFTDTGLTNGLTYYYTAFAYDFAGNYSSGAIASAVPFKGIPPLLPEEISTEEECIEAGFYWYNDTCHREPELPPPPPEIEELTLEDFDFIQEEQKLLLIEKERFELKSELPLDIEIDYEKVPEVLKTIMVTLEKPAYIPKDSQKIEEKKTFSFLLRINKEKTAYQAAIVPPEPGTYPLILTVLDYKNQTLKKIFGKLTVYGTKPPEPKIPWYKQWENWIWILLIILGLILIIHFIKKKIREKSEEEKSYGP